MSQPPAGWQIKCSKCGKVIRDITEIEYVEMKLKGCEDSFLGRSNEMKARLAELKEEADE